MVSRNEFLALVLPPLEEGEHYCGWGIKGKDNTRQRFVTSIEALSDNSDELQKAGDILVILGKGHETGQEIKGVKHAFSDQEVLQKCIEAKL